MNIIPIHRVDDPRIALFRNVRDSEMLDQWGLFVAEGEHLVRRVLDSRFKVQSVLIEEAYQEKLLPLLPADTPVYMVDKKLIREIARFDFNRGALALVVRQPLPSPTQLPIFQKKQSGAGDLSGNQRCREPRRYPAHCGRVQRRRRHTG